VNTTTHTAPVAQPDEQPAILSKQVADWRKEVARLQDLIAHATGAPVVQIDLDSLAQQVQRAYMAGVRFVAFLSPAKILDLIALARAGQQVGQQAGDAAGDSNSVEFDGIKTGDVETEMADRLRRIALNRGPGRIEVAAKTLNDVASECDRFYNGMMAWKESAQKKDARLIEQNTTIADLRAQLASERAAKEYEQRHAVESEKALAQVQAQLASARQDAELWSKESPTEQGEYWHWNGEEDTAPYIYHILWSGTAKKCFVSIGQYGITEASFCDEFGGWWKRIPQPAIPSEAARTQHTNTTATGE